MQIRLHVTRAVAFVLLLASALCLGAASQQAEKPVAPVEHAMGTRLHSIGIPNFAEVTPSLYRGAQPSHEGLEALKNLGVNLVVDLRGGTNKDEEETAKKLGMQYIAIPSHCPYPRDEPFAKFLRVLRENPAKKVFVHCRLGDDRTGMAVASYRMAEQGWSAEEAMKEMKTFGFSSIHHAMCPGLADYEESFPERLKKDQAFKELQPYEAGATAK
jgi:tyrosine-protein phosphatase SIW14